MFRRLLNFATTISIIMSLAVAALWWRSYRRWDNIISPRPAEGLGIGSAHGQIVMNVKWTRVGRAVGPLRFESAGPDVLELDDGTQFVLQPETLQRSDVALRSVTHGFEWRSIVTAPPDRARAVIYDEIYTVKIATPAGPRPTAGDQYLRLAVPHWSIIALLGVWSFPRGVLMLARAVKRRTRRREGHCVGCGYDLRATRERCPECGLDVRSSSPTCGSRTGDAESKLA